MKRLTASELVRNFGEYGDAALKEPIVVTRNGCSQALPYENEVLGLLATADTSISDRPLAK